MTACAWMLTECGQVAPLLPGATSSDVLPTGPIFELVLRSQPPAKLLYTHTPSANVNATASALAGHAVKGDACLLVSPRLATSPSQGLLLDGLLGGSGGVTRLTPHQPPHPSPLSGAAPAPAPGSSSSSSPGGRSWAARQQQQERQRCPHTAMRAILHSKNAAAAASAAVAAAPTAALVREMEPRAGASGGTAAVAPTAAALSLGRAASWEQPLAPPCKSARSSREYAPHLHNAVSVSRPASPGVGRLALQFADSSCGDGFGGQLGQGLQQGQDVRGVEGEGPVMVAAMDSAFMELEEEEGWPQQQQQQQSSCGSMAMADMQQQQRGNSAAEESVAMEMAVEREEAAEVEVPWGDLAGDVVASIAMNLPQQASQAQSMASVCHGWRAAILGHAPALRRIAFTLDPANHLRRRTASSSPASSTSSSAASTSPDAANPTRSAPSAGCASTCASSSAAASASPAAARAGDAGTPIAGAGPTAATGMHVSSSTSSSTSTSTSSKAQLNEPVDECAVLTAAISRQYKTGVFVLPLHAAATSGRQALGNPGAEEDLRPAHGSHAVHGAEDHEAAAAPPPVPREAVRQIPRLLLAAALSASNPSAQLLMAQLLEGSGDADGSIRWWRKLATGGDAMGMFKLGMACYDGSHGMQSDLESAHMWLGRAVRHILRVDSIAAIPLDDRSTQHGQQGPGRAQAAAAGTGVAPMTVAGGQQQRAAARVSTALKQQLSSLDAPLLRMLGCSTIVLGYLEFDGVAGRSVWGMGDRSESVRMFRLADACGLPEAAAVLGWLYNTGQY